MSLAGGKSLFTILLILKWLFQQPHRASDTVAPDKRERMPYIVHKRMPYIVHKRMPYIVHKRMPYIVHKRMPYIIHKRSQENQISEKEVEQLLETYPPQKYRRVSQETRSSVHTDLGNSIYFLI
jgi:hypothetical protein